MEPARSLKDTLVFCGKRLREGARLMIGVPDYETYVAHMRQAHPGQPVMSYAEFFRERLKAIAAEGGFEHQIIFAGFQENAIDYMRLMDIVAHTSTHPEPFGIVTLEAMLASRPLVSTTIGGPAEVVISGETGLLVEPGKPELLAAALESLLDDPARAADMARRGRARLDSHFSLAANLSRTMEVYERILARTTA